jgi:hypothetical protein
MLKASTNKAHHLALLRISDAEAQSLAACFRLYDYEAKGVISKESAIKLIKSLGFTIPSNKLSSEIEFQELLLILDQWAPKPEPPLECALATWSQLAGHHRKTTEEKDELYVSSEDIAAFMESVGKPPISLGEAHCLLSSLLEVDDCSDKPEVAMDVFAKQLSLYARKANLIKDLHKLM